LTFARKITLRVTGRKHRLETNREGIYPAPKDGRTAKGKI
jgi:hypothetical protein